MKKVTIESQCSFAQIHSVEYIVLNTSIIFTGNAKVTIQFILHLDNG